jgi:hypothetical protein
MWMFLLVQVLTANLEQICSRQRKRLWDRPSLVYLLDNGFQSGDTAIPEMDNN